MKRCFKYEISGLVQGVGFRPFVYNLALRLNLKGEIYNDDEGVKLKIFGEELKLREFEKAVFNELPNLARIDSFQKEEIDEKFSELKIIASKSAKKHAPILPDFALCADCEREFSDPSDRRYGYAFINCTNCGPRFSIIRKLPYDRPNTTMSEFAMCELCKMEYENPLDRRYHAQPISCPNCGPKLVLKDKNGEFVADGEESVKIAAKLINEGKILAVKGLGGFHLVCDATNENAVNELRIRKRRPKKPFAIMCKDLNQAKIYAEISEAEAAILTSNLKPIVVLKSLEISSWNHKNSFQALTNNATGKFNELKGAMACFDSTAVTKNKVCEYEKMQNLAHSLKFKALNENFSAEEISKLGANALNFTASEDVLCGDRNLTKGSLNFIAAQSKPDVSNDFSVMRMQNLSAAPKSKIVALIAPNLDKIGIFLPYTGVHHSLFKYLNAPIVATSANISGEPIIADGEELRVKLQGVIDFYLDNDREICSPSDDSIAFVIDNEPVFIRTSRGINPKFISSKFNSPKTILAVGAELKNQFAIFKDGQIMMSPYIGDLKNIATYERFCKLIEIFSETYELKFDEIVADSHPHFLNLRWAHEYAAKNGAKITQIQHHYAHLLSVMFENDLDPKKEYLGFCFDGTGYGEDGHIWGGEVLRVSRREFARAAHFDEFSLIGGESSIKNIWQIAYSIILKYDLEEFAKNFLSSFDTMKLQNLKKLHERNLNLVKTTSLGRIFDAFGSVILGLDTISYEGEAGMELEAYSMQQLINQ